MENKIDKSPSLGRIQYLNTIVERAWNHYTDGEYLKLGKELGDYQYIEYRIK